MRETYLAKVVLPTFEKLMCFLCMMAVSGISMRVMTVSSQDRFSITKSTRKVLTTLRTMALAFSATMRPIMSTSECRREERLPGGGKEVVGRRKLYVVSASRCSAVQ